MKGSLRAAAVTLALFTALASALLPTATASAADKPTVTLSAPQAGKGGNITVTGKGWRPNALLMMLICGQSEPSRGVIGGTNSCANSDGRAVTTDAKGAFSKKMPVSEPPKPCPCVVHVATVTGQAAAEDTVFKVAGHPTAPLPDPAGGGRLGVLAATRLDGSSGVLTWFGAPPTRRLVFTVGNLGSAPVKDPVFQLGVSHGVFAPQWEDQQWHGTIEPGQKAEIKLDVQLAAGAHGDYQVAMKYGSKVLIEQPWGVGRPWGVTFFWILLCLVVPAAVFRIGMAVIDRVRPQGAGRHRTVRLSELTVKMPQFRTPKEQRQTPAASSPEATRTTTVLPWFTPDTAPSETHPTTKGNT
ncbi:hypothetical protein J0695_00705 [Streptomyces beijiangensis]|uniref:Neocarzinostatin family protein n=1 Tax=Streptomyces beijiangensis TaxID=163361 RepID=A0A939F233_9ACTN|nr:hypothetical protein [Streptomyces beijiangensis]